MTDRGWTEKHSSLWIMRALGFVCATCIILAISGIVYLGVNPSKSIPAIDHRLERACADVMLKQRLAEAWERDPARVDDAKLIEVTIAGVMAICADVPAEKP